MSKTILLFDIDYTIFNTHRYKKNTAEYICARFHIDEKEMKQFDKDYREERYDPAGVNMKDYTERLGKRFSLPTEDLFQLLIDTADLYVETLYPDTISTLSLLSKKYTLGIFSQGYLSFQMNKLIKTNIHHFFDKKHIYIYPKKTHEDILKQLPKNAMIIDDKLFVVQTVVKHIPAIHMNRSTDPHLHTPSIRSLSEIIDILSL